MMREPYVSELKTRLRDAMVKHAASHPMTISLYSEALCRIEGLEAQQHIVPWASELYELVKAIVADDDAGTSLADQRARWPDHMRHARQILDAIELTAVPPNPEGHGHFEEGEW